MLPQVTLRLLPAPPPALSGLGRSMSCRTKNKSPGGQRWGGGDDTRGKAYTELCTQQHYQVK